MVVAGSATMALGALVISFAAAPEQELEAWQGAAERECLRYGLARDRVFAAMRGDDPVAHTPHASHWWEWLVAAVAIGIAIWLASYVRPQPVVVSTFWMTVLAGATLASLIGGGLLLWKRTRFS